MFEANPYLIFMQASSESYIPVSALRRFTENVFRKIGCTDQDAELAADVLIKADLRGVDSHGVARLPGYVKLWEKGRINPNPEICIVHETATTATVDGDKGLGLIVAVKAMQIAIEKARIYGSGWVAVKNSNHFGIAAYHAMLALENNMIGYAMTNASPLVAPTFSTEALLGTNPICYAFPAGKHAPVVVDIATSSVSNGKLEIAQRAQEQIPTGWAQDLNGKETTDAAVLKKGGTLLPLGSDRIHSSHKGYALGATVDILSAVLSGANYGPWAPPFVAFLDPAPNPVGEGLGHFLGAMRVDGFRPIEAFKQHMDQWISRFKKAKRADENQPVIIPGEPELVAEKDRLNKGIPLKSMVIESLKDLAKNFTIASPFDK